jgi:DNA-binding NarL/FixJ family response regulator
MTKIFLVDDHRIFRESFSLLLTQEKIGHIVAEASNGAEFLEKLDQNMPDLVFMDILMPVMDGMEATKRAIEKYPDLRVIALTSSDDEKYYHKMVASGVKGFVLKNSGILEIELAINEIMLGGCWFSNEILRKIITKVGKKEPDSKENQLTKRETEVLVMICKGYQNEQIAEELHISYETVRSHKSNLLSKTKSQNLASLILYAIKNKVIEIEQ